MKFIEVRTALRRATKEDLFTGEIYNLKGIQGIKDNTTVFYRNLKTGNFQGPHTLFSYSDFSEIYWQIQMGMLGIIVPIPNVVSNEFLFDLVLREASIDDMKDTPRHIKLNRIYYIFNKYNLLGPFFINKNTTSLYLENMIAANQIFVPNERQHFNLKEEKKSA